MEFNFNRSGIPIVFIICFIFLSISASIIYITRPNGYEVSIYAAVPMVAWFFLLLPLFFGIFITLQKALTQNVFRDLIADYQFLAGVLLLLISGIIFSSIPIIRGYYQWGRGDPFTHLLVIQEIGLTGHIPDELIYPLSHTYIVIIGLVTHLDSSVIMSGYTLLLAVPFILFSYLFARGFLGEKTAILFLIFTLTGSIASPYFFAGTIPSYLFLLTIYVFVILTQHKDSSRIPFFIVLTILIIAIVLGHPNAVINSAVIMMVIFIFFKYEEYTTKIQNNIPIGPFFVLIILFFTWISQFVLFRGTLTQMRDILFTQHDKSQMAILQQSISYASSYGYSWVEMFCKVYGRTAIILFISMFALYIILKENQTTKKRIVLTFILSLVFILCTAVLYTTNAGFGPDRMLGVAVIFSSLLMVLVFYFIRDWKFTFKNFHFSSRLLIISLVIGLCIMGLLSFYPSPYVLTGNDQFTLNEQMGLEWLGAKSDGKNVVNIGLGETVSRAGFVLKYPPYHFGYDKTPLLGNSFTEDTYYIRVKLDELLYTDVFPKVARYRWQPEDFRRLENDGSIDKYYSNGDTEIMLINAKR